MFYFKSSVEQLQKERPKTISAIGIESPVIRKQGSQNGMINTQVGHRRQNDRKTRGKRDGLLVCDSNGMISSEEGWEINTKAKPHLVCSNYMFTHIITFPKYAVNCTLVFFCGMDSILYS